MTSKFTSLFSTSYSIIGALHLIPLPGYKGFSNIDKIREAALYDLDAMITGGVDGVIIENNYDLPHLTQVGPETVATMTVLTQEIKQRTSLPVGISVL